MSHHALTFALCFPFGGRYVPPEWAVLLANLEFPMGASRVWLTTKRVKRDLARNTLVKEAIRLNARYVFFVDDDTMPPPDVLVKLYREMEAADEDVIACGGVYTSKKPNPEPLIFNEIGGGPHWKWKAGDVFPVAAIGTGCLLIRTSAFAKIPEPWFRDIPSVAEIGDDPSIQLMPGASFYMTDDVYFCNKAQQAGLKILAHGGVLPLHWDQQGKPYFLPPDSPPMRGVDQKTLWYNQFGSIQSKS